VCRFLRLSCGFSGFKDSTRVDLADCCRTASLTDENPKMVSELGEDYDL
jgi:hypothetical protein